MFDATSGLAVGFREAIVISVVLILGAALAGALTGLIILTKVADIIVTLAMLFVWGGAALAVMQIPGGGTPLRFSKLAIGYTLTPLAPIRARHPRRRRAPRLGADPGKPGLSLYAIGSSRNASFLAGISVAKTGSAPTRSATPSRRWGGWRWRRRRGSATLSPASTTP